MTLLERQTLRLLANAWQAEADVLQARSQDTWVKLGRGELAQDDALIYSVYEDQSRADQLRECAHELLKGLP